MIKLHRIRGEEFFLNADLVESVENTPDTVLTLFDGRKIVVSESAEEVSELITYLRASVLRLADATRSGERNLVAFPGGRED
jgi:flagellar protein FlbD